MHYNFSIVLFLSCIFASGCGTDSNKQIREESKQTETDSASQASVNKEILEQLTKLREETSDLRSKVAEIQSRPVAPRVSTQSFGVVQQPADQGDPPEPKPSDFPIHVAAGIGDFARVKELVEDGLNFNAMIEGTTALHCAISNGREKIVRYLVENGADLNLKDSDGWMPGDMAIQYGRETLLGYLKENGAQITPPQPIKEEPQNKEQDSIVELSVKEEQKLEDTSASSQANLEQRLELTAFLGIQDGKAEAVKISIDDGFNPNKRFSPTLYSDSKHPGGILPLTFAIKQGHLEIVQLLLSNGTTPVHDAKTGDIPLISAIIGDQAHHHHGEGDAVHHERYHQIILHLLKAAPSLASKSDGESFPLTYAASVCDEELVATLLQAGAAPNVLDKNGLTPLHLAVIASDHVHGSEVGHSQASRAGTVRREETSGHKKAVINLLLAKGADVNAVSPNGGNALFFAITRGFRDLAMLLVEKGAELNSTNAGSQAIMLQVAYMGDVDLAKLMVLKGAKVEVSDDNGSTVLHAAAAFGNLEFCKYLIESGAKPNPRILRGPFSGDTPLDAAYSGSNDTKMATIKYLKSVGAKSGRSE